MNTVLEYFVPMLFLCAKVTACGWMYPLPAYHIFNNKGVQARQTSASICRNTIITGKSFIRSFTR